jgi:hypothetical protein
MWHDPGPVCVEPRDFSHSNTHPNSDSFPDSIPHTVADSNSHSHTHAQAGPGTDSVEPVYVRHFWL